MVLVVTHLCLNVKISKNCIYTFRAEISDYIKNYAHHGGNKPHREIGCGYIFNVKNTLMIVR